LPPLSPDPAQCLALAAGVLLLGLFLKRRVSALDRLNIPAPVIGGLLAAVVILFLRQNAVHFDFADGLKVLKPVLQNAFFTSIGMLASLPLLRRGGWQVAVFLAMSAFLCLVQNSLGMAIAAAFNLNKLVGVVAGSVTLVGGPATGIAFADKFEQLGVAGADSLAIASATFGIVCGGLFGGPLGTWIISQRLKRQPRTHLSAEAQAEIASTEEGTRISIDVTQEDTPLLRNVIVLVIAMGIGVVVSRWIESKGITLPSYIGAMLVASALRNLDDWTGWFRVSERHMDLLGNVSLTVFLALALLDLKLWEIAYLAGPLVLILLAQALVLGVFCLVVSYPVMGRDYDSAVMASGLYGFAMGTTANALANMRALVERYGAAPKAFLVVPLVGAFFIDFVNAAIITAYLNWFGR